MIISLYRDALELDIDTLVGTVRLQSLFDQKMQHLIQMVLVQASYIAHRPLLRRFFPEIVNLIELIPFTFDVLSLKDANLICICFYFVSQSDKNVLPKFVKTILHECRRILLVEDVVDTLKVSMLRISPLTARCIAVLLRPTHSLSPLLSNSATVSF